MSNDASISFQVVAHGEGGAVALVSTTKIETDIVVGNKNDYERDVSNAAFTRQDASSMDADSEIAIYNPSATRATV